LLTADRVAVPTGFSGDGRFLLYFEANSLGNGNLGSDLMVLPLTGDRKPFTLLSAERSQIWGSLSPDGQWLVYQSEESGQAEIYVRPFTSPESVTGGEIAKVGQWQVSSEGGATPLWRRDGKEIHFLATDGVMMGAAFSADGATPVISPAVKLFQTRILGGGGFGVDAALGRQYDVAPDGRFLINSVVDTDSVPPITLVQNWDPARED
jgi:eukaryotic-like serine/threonine-protein kinase